MKKILLTLSLIIMVVSILTGCQYDPLNHDTFSVTNATSKNVKYIDNYEYYYEIIIPSGERKQIINRWDRQQMSPKEIDYFGYFIFDDTLPLRYHPRDTFSRNIYKNYEIEKFSESKGGYEAYYHYTLTEEDYQNALQQNQR